MSLSFISYCICLLWYFREEPKRMTHWKTFKFAALDEIFCGLSSQLFKASWSLSWKEAKIPDENSEYYSRYKQNFTAFSQCNTFSNNIWQPIDLDVNMICWLLLLHSRKNQQFFGHEGKLGIQIIQLLKMDFWRDLTTSLCPFGQAYIKGVHPRLSLGFISMLPQF